MLDAHSANAVVNATLMASHQPRSYNLPNAILIADGVVKRLISEMNDAKATVDA
jgi:hypothetical protein